MAISDPIADMLTRIRNANRNNSVTVDIRNSKVCAGVARVLRDEGYVTGFDIIDDGRQGVLRVELKYGSRGEKLIGKIKRESKPGLRVYRGVKDFPRPLGGLGICIISTPKGVLSDREAITQGVGGELLATVE